MAHKFKQGDPVYYTAPEEYTALSGLYTVQQVSSDGLTYRIVDYNKEFTDVDEDEIVDVSYAIFVRLPEGWPIIVPVYDEKLYNYFRGSHMYQLAYESSAANCLDEQVKLLKQLEKLD